MPGLPTLLHCKYHPRRSSRFCPLAPSPIPARHNGLTLLRMVLFDTPLTATQVLHTFHRDEPYLFLGAAFITVGLVAIGFCALRRRFDALLVWLAVFAYLYGQRMWLDSGLL